jgi:hypothetical protein
MTAPTPAPMKNIVIVTIDPKLEKLTEPEYFEIYKGLHQQVQWVSTEPKAYFTVEFEHGSPFHYAQFSADYPYSGEVRREVLGDPGKKYKYTVRFKKGEKSFMVDPGGVVNP